MLPTGWPSDGTAVHVHLVHPSFHAIHSIPFFIHSHFHSSVHPFLPFPVPFHISSSSESHFISPTTTTCMDISRWSVCCGISRAIVLRPGPGLVPHSMPSVPGWRCPFPNSIRPIPPFRSIRLPRTEFSESTFHGVGGGLDHRPPRLAPAAPASSSLSAGQADVDGAGGDIGRRSDDWPAGRPRDSRWWWRRWPRAVSRQPALRVMTLPDGRRRR